MAVFTLTQGKTLIYHLVNYFIGKFNDFRFCSTNVIIPPTPPLFCFQSRFFTLRTIYFTHGKYYRFRIIFLHEKDGFKIFNHTGSTMAKWVFRIDSDRHKNASKILFKGDFGLKSIEISRCKQLSDWSAIQSWIDFF